MMYWSAYGWQAVMYALIAGLWAGAVMMAATWIRRHTRRWCWMTADALAGAALVMLLARALWQGTEGSFRHYMVLAMLAGLLLFRWGPQALAEALARWVKGRRLRDKG